MTDTKGEPVTGTVILNDTRIVRIKLSNCSRAVDPQTGHMLVPDTLFIEWRNGRLVDCRLAGPRLRSDGGTYLDERRTGRSFVNRHLPPPYVIDDDTPNWVRELVIRHQPALARVTASV